MPYGMMPPFVGLGAAAPPCWQPEGMHQSWAAAAGGSSPIAGVNAFASGGLGPAEMLIAGSAVTATPAPANHQAVQQAQEPGATAPTSAAGLADAASGRQSLMASSPGPLSTTPATPAVARGDASKGLEAEQTPATTAGRSSLQRSPAEEKEEDHEDERSHTPLQKMLFGGESGSVGTPAEKEGQDMLLEGPPGLC